MPAHAEPSRIIMHVDMDAFYASIEQRDNPELKGKPVIVGGSGPRGVVAAASYEVREFGVYSAMASKEAARRCPDAVFVKPRISHYRETSDVIFDIFRDMTPIYEGLSLDEAFLDFTGEPGIEDKIETTALSIKRRILEATQLTASVGVGPNKLVAKIASDINKPDGLCMLFDDNIRQTLDPMQANRIPGIGKKTYAKLEQIDIHTIQDLRRAPDAALAAVFGRYAMRIKSRSQGIDDRPVTPHLDDKSISAETTFDTDLSSDQDMIDALLPLADRVAERARQKNLQGSVVQIKIRTADFKTQTRQMRLQPPSNSSAHLKSQSRALLEDWRAEHPAQEVRLLGVGISGLIEQRQLGLFEAPSENHEGVDQVLDNIREKYGIGAVKRGSRLR